MATILDLSGTSLEERNNIKNFMSYLPFNVCVEICGREWPLSQIRFNVSFGYIHYNDGEKICISPTYTRLKLHRFDFENLLRDNKIKALMERLCITNYNTEFKQFTQNGNFVPLFAMPYSFIEALKQSWFDVHNLIEANLAIPYN